MKKIILLTLLLGACFLNQVSAQWTEKNFNLTNLIYVTDIEFIDNNNGFIIGVDGNLKNFIAKTTNGGDSWSIKFNQVDYLDLLAIASPSVIYATGFDANFDVVMAKSTDGGNTWTFNVSAIFENAIKLQFLDANNGIFTDGDDLMKTTDGGANWNAITVPAVTGGIYSFHFMNLNVGYMLAQNYNTYEMEIWKTTNGGTTWAKQLSTTENLEFVHFFSEEVGVAYDAINIYYTNNGSTWTKALIPNFGGISEVKMVSATTGFAADSDYILKTTDGGATWNISKDYSGFALILPNVLAFPTSSTGYVAGFGGYFAKTGNGGGVGIEETQPTSYIIYPNPATDQITVIFDPSTVSGDLRVDILNLLGQKVFSENISAINGKFDLNIPNLSEGTYILNITNDQKTVSTKISIH